MTSSTPLGIGDTCYSQHGQEAVLLAKAGGQYIVAPIYEDDDGQHQGEAETWAYAYRTPPAPKLDAATKAAEERLQSLRAQVYELERKQREFERDEKARLERIKQHEELAELDRYLAGEITHYVGVHDYYPTVEIIPIGEAIDDYASSNGYGLVTLMPSRRWDKKIHFSLYQRQRYPRDSRTIKVIPCCGEEAANAKAAEVLAGFVADQLAQEPKDRRYTQQLIDACRVRGVLVPQALIDDLREQTRKSLEAQRDRIAKDLEEVTAKLANEETK